MRRPMTAVASILFVIMAVLVVGQLRGEMSLADVAGPESDTAVVLVEGEETLLNLNRFVAPEAWSTRLSTYFPDDFLVETSRTLEGFSVKFIANFGGFFNPDAFLEIFLFAPGLKQPEIDAVTAKLVETYKLTPNQGNRFEWSTAEYGLTVARSTITHLAVGVWNGQPLYVLTHYPAEYGDGFGPRAAVILERLEWGS
ncbi:MAG: hypothetical protein GX058_06510 [Firmicutes bacterium]|nr:hypothetical protein [Bacillota bacterium]